MKVLHVIDACSRGGAETLLYDICKNSRGNGLHVEFCTFLGGELEPEFQKLDIRCYNLGRKFPVDLALIYKLRKIIKSQCITTVHTHGSVDLLHAYIALIGLPIVHIHTHHGYSFDAPKKNQLAEWLILPRVSGHVFVSNAILNYRKKSIGNGGLTFVIENGVDIERVLGGRSQGNSFKSELMAGDSEPVLCMVGNFVNEVRDQMLVCKALEVLFNKGYSFTFAFVGRGSRNSPGRYEECMMFCENTGISGKVKFLGGRNDVSDILSECDLFVYASNHDTFGIAVVEAMAAGVPVIVNDLEPFKVIGKDGEFLNMYRTKSVESMVGMIESYFKNDKEFKSKASRARVYVKQQYGIERVIKDLANAYNIIENVNDK